MNRHNSLKTICLLLALLFLCAGSSALAETQSHNPLIDPVTITRSTATKQRFTNILLLGVDYGFDGYWGSNHKKVLRECHTDAFMIASINMTTAEVNLISIPRDTVTYIPGVYGVYKLNGAFNCGETLEEGFKHACDAASWHLGGVKIDHYVCVDMAAMVALVDYIGGVDMDIEMNMDSNGRHYTKGHQHLDGQAAMDYARARKTAQINANDMGRTNRQRQVVTAIFSKLHANASQAKSAWNYATGGTLNFFTDMKLGTLVNLLNKVKDTKNVGNYVLSASITMAARWAFSIADQAKRQEVLREVFGIEAEPVSYVSAEYLNWLNEIGFNYVHAVRLARDILKFGNALTNKTQAQNDALNALTTATEAMAAAFDTAAEKKCSGASDYRAPQSEYSTLCSVGNNAAVTLGYATGNLDWHKASAWNDDPWINQYQYNWA